MQGSTAKTPQPGASPAANTPDAVDFLGLTFQPRSTRQAARTIAASALGSESFWYVVTPNVDHMVRLQREKALRGLYDEAGLVLNDSRILELLAGFEKIDLPASPGADIVQTLFEKELDPEEPVVVIGCTASEISALKARFGLSDVRWHDPPMGLRNKPEAVKAAAEFMARNPARFHFLCVGSPQQEMVALAAKQLGNVQGVGLCCGASLDFLTGRTTRAPEWMRKFRLEWLHRLTSEPQRMFKRYLIDGPKIFGMWQRDKKRRRQAA
ncbi:MAG TPA: glycosyltransferase [Henriciella marina]|uniref:WecB/TagA/CpsF family glycosyltransferase n=1 Tax=Henriciella sp. TaxID=1968823 RepID=UPI0017EEDC6C|nr:WecB/TagA/CpsF family glycosyltransferase [Henriciella sp.]HIG23908.1 glycosyltransferase [Henriciella sp.]HIK65832.1 glycosyltransferase [Henriciella marina]